MENNIPFIKTRRGIVAILLLTIILAGTLLVLVDRAPRPRTQAAAEWEDGFNIDPNLDPGYTVGEKHADDVGNVQYLIQIIILGSVTTLFIYLLLSIDVESTGEEIGRSIFGGLIYGILVLILLNFGIGIRYYPPGVEIWNRVSPLLLRGIAFQMGLLSGVLYVYQKPLIPDINDSDLRFHGDIWWRYTQVILSVSVALSVGALLPFLLETSTFQGRSILIVLLFLFATITAVVLFSVSKMETIEGVLRDE